MPTAPGFQGSPSLGKVESTFVSSYPFVIITSLTLHYTNSTLCSEKSDFVKHLQIFRLDGTVFVSKMGRVKNHEKKFGAFLCSSLFF